MRFGKMLIFLMNDNPFTSDIYIKIWLNHFNQKKPAVHFDSISDLSFVKHQFLPKYINVGKVITKGISYRLGAPTTKDHQKKVFLIYDVPSYFKIESTANNHLKSYRIRQYPGFLIKLDDYHDFNHYFTSIFDGKSRNKLRSYKKKLESTFDIRYKMYFGYIPREEYNSIFDSFRMLLEKRFNDKGVSNNNLKNKEWNFYREVSYPMILEKRASLFVTFDSEKPIGIMLNYMSGKILFGAMTVFDIEYSKFNVGSVNIMKLIEWCMANDFKILDFSKGAFHYKKRWANLEYDFEYHILFDPKALYSKCLAYMLASYFRLKQYLRDKKVNERFHKISFLLSR